MATKALGWLKPEPKHYARCKAGPHASDLLSGVVPAESADNSKLVTIIDQQNLGSCTCNAVAQVIHAEMVRKGAPASTEFLSRLMAYYLARYEDGQQSNDAGTQICTAFDAVSRVGFAPESAWPYDVAWFAKMPPSDAFRLAFDQRGQVDVNYHRLDGNGVAGDDLLYLIRQALTAGKLVTWGAPVSEQYCSNLLGAVPIQPPLNLPIAGGHAQTLCGYGTTPDGLLYFRDVNSWGTGWGDGGFCNISPEYIMWGETSDMWIVTLAPRFSI